MNKFFVLYCIVSNFCIINHFLTALTVITDDFNTQREALFIFNSSGTVRSIFMTHGKPHHMKLNCPPTL